MDKKTRNLLIVIALIIGIGIALHQLNKSLEKKENLANFYLSLQRANSHNIELVKKDTYTEALSVMVAFKQYIENEDGYKLCYGSNGKPNKEKDIQLLFKAICARSESHVTREANNGRGPADFIFSYGSKDVTVIELKMASNSKLRANLENLNQLGVYMRANKTEKGAYVILAFNQKQFNKVHKILDDLNLQNNPGVLVIDARNNKLSASIVA